jgi:hypothetical protein
VTVRESLTGQMRRWWILAGLGFATMMAGPITAGALGAPKTAALLAFGGVLVFAVALLGLQFRVRCPRCRGALGRIATTFGDVLLRFPKRLMFCPYCALDLDSPIDS